MRSGPSVVCMVPFPSPARQHTTRRGDWPNWGRSAGEASRPAWRKARNSMFDAGLTTPMRLRYTAAAQAAQVESFGPATVRRQRAMDVYTPLDPAQVLVSMLLPIGDT